MHRWLEAIPAEYTNIGEMYFMESQNEELRISIDGCHDTVAVMLCL